MSEIESPDSSIEPDDEPAVTILTGRKVDYQNTQGDTCSMSCSPLSDGGSYWEFTRSGRVYPLRLSKESTNMMVSLWHEVFYKDDNVFLKSSTSP